MAVKSALRTLLEALLLVGVIIVVLALSGNLNNENVGIAIIVGIVFIGFWWWRSRRLARRDRHGPLLPNGNH